MMIQVTATRAERAEQERLVVVAVWVAMAAHFLVSKRVAVTVELVEQEAHLPVAVAAVLGLILLIKPPQDPEEWVAPEAQAEHSVCLYGV
jgi:hypothetical protein